MSRSIARDIVALAGFAAVVAGVWQLDPSWAQIVGGGLLLAALRWPGRSRSAETEDIEEGDADVA